MTTTSTHTVTERDLDEQIDLCIAAARASGWDGASDGEYCLTSEDCDSIADALGADDLRRGHITLDALRAGAMCGCLCRECCAGRPDGCTTLAR